MAKHILLKSLFSLTALLAFTSCEDDEPEVATQTTTQFIQDELTFSEHETSSEISILLNQTAAQEGTITISVSSDNLNGFTTDPAIVDGQIQLLIMQGQGDATFSFSPVDNTALNENTTINFTIASVSEGLVIGEKKALSVLIVDNESPALVSFQGEPGSTLENAGSKTAISVAFSHPSPGAGSIEVSLTSDKAQYGIHYVTEPEAVNGKVVLPVEPGIDNVAFNVLPLDDELFNGNRNIQYTISQTAGAVNAGQTITNTLKITDDELHGVGKGYSTGGGGWGYKKEFEYNEQGKISKILWEQSAPGNSLSGSSTYEYDANGNVIKMTESNATVTTYTWENGRIVKEESVRDGEIKKYILYGYDDAGNVGESAIYYRQPNGELKFSMLIVFLYYLDGNLYKQMNYSPIEGSEDYNLLSTKTWESYSTKENQFTMVELLPNHTTQPNLPLSYRLEEGGHNILFQFTYEFNADGQPTKRTATSSTGSEVSTYEYY